MLLTKEQIIERNNRPHREVTKTFEYGDYFIIEMTTEDSEVRYRGYILNEEYTVELTCIYPTIDMCLLDCICCKYENVSMSHATEYILNMLDIKK